MSHPLPPIESDEVMHLEELVRRAIVRTLRKTGGNKIAAALGIHKTTLYRKLQIIPHGSDPTVRARPQNDRCFLPSILGCLLNQLNNRCYPPDVRTCFYGSVKSHYFGPIAAHEARVHTWPVKEVRRHRNNLSEREK